MPIGYNSLSTDQDGRCNDETVFDAAGVTMTETAAERAEHATNNIDFLCQTYGYGEIYPRDKQKLTDYLITDPTLTARLLDATKRPASLSKLDNVTVELEITAACMNACAHFFEQHHRILSDDPSEDAALTARLKQCAADSLGLLAKWDEREQIMANTFVTEPTAGSMAARYAADKEPITASQQKGHAFFIRHHIKELLAEQKEALQLYRDKADQILHHHHEPAVLRICTVAERNLQTALEDIDAHFKSFGRAEPQRG